jgi:hypothetical protein
MPGQALGMLSATPHNAHAAPELAELLVDLTYPPEALPAGLTPTWWHQAARSVSERNFGRAVRQYSVIGSQVDVARCRVRLAEDLAATGQPAAANLQLDLAARALAGTNTVDLAGIRDQRNQWAC